MVVFPSSLGAPRREEGRARAARRRSHTEPAVSKREGKTGPLDGNKKYFPRTHTHRNIIRPKYLSQRVCFPFPFIPEQQGLTGGNILGRGKGKYQCFGFWPSSSLCHRTYKPEGGNLFPRRVVAKHPRSLQKSPKSHGGCSRAQPQQLQSLRHHSLSSAPPKSGLSAWCSGVPPVLWLPPRLCHRSAVTRGRNNPRKGCRRRTQQLITVVPLAPPHI